MDNELVEINKQLFQIKWGIIAICFFMISLIYISKKK